MASSFANSVILSLIGVYFVHLNIITHQVKGRILRRSCGDYANFSYVALDKVLEGEKITTLIVPSEEECELACVDELQCKSINIEKSKKARRCELNKRSTADASDGVALTPRSDLHNIALGKITSQSSTYMIFGSDNAIDGHQTDTFSDSRFNCIHTENEKRPWWSVYFQGMAVVYKIAIFARSDGYYDRLGNLDVKLGNVDEPGKNNLIWDCPWFSKEHKSRESNELDTLLSHSKLKCQADTFGVLCVNLHILLHSVNGRILRRSCGDYADFSYVELDKVLEGEKIKTVIVPSEEECELACVDELQCKSINIEKSKNARRCELNKRSTADASDGVALTPRSGWVYKSTSYTDNLIGHMCRKLDPCEPEHLCLDVCYSPGYKCTHCKELPLGMPCVRSK
eukprot:gene6736-12299_t